MLTLRRKKEVYTTEERTASLLWDIRDRIDDTDKKARKLDRGGKKAEASAMWVRHLDWLDWFHRINDRFRSI